MIDDEPTPSRRPVWKLGGGRVLVLFFFKFFLKKENKIAAYGSATNPLSGPVTRGRMPW
jgi:hypothetical protein